MATIPPNQHLERARTGAAEADLHNRVVAALDELLQRERGTDEVVLIHESDYPWQPQQQQQQYSPHYQQQSQQLPAIGSVQGGSWDVVKAFLERRTAWWPPEMRAYLFSHIQEIFGALQQQQQQQQQQQSPSPEPWRMPLGKYLHGLMARTILPAQHEAERARKFLEAIKDVAQPDGTRPDSMEPDDAAAKSVEFRVYGPRRISQGKTFSLDVWGFPADRVSKVEELARRLGQNAAGPAAVGSVPPASLLAVHVYSHQLEISQPVRSVEWHGQETVESFECRIEDSVQAWESIVGGTVTITMHGLLVASLMFFLRVGKAEDATRDAIEQRAIAPRAAFVSYASENRIDVLRSVQGIQKGAPQLQIFLDVDTLSSGDNWAEKLAAYIWTSDILYLFWSAAAAKSEWVGREWRQGFNEKGLAFIDPVPLESPELVPPPNELKSLHFNDRYLEFIQAQQWINSRKGPQPPEVAE